MTGALARTDDEKRVEEPRHEEWADRLAGYALDLLLLAQERAPATEIGLCLIRCQWSATEMRRTAPRQDGGQLVRLL